MDILLWIILGAVAGWIASILTHNSSGILWDIVLGVIGGFLGGFLLNLFGASGQTGFNFYSLFVAVIGAVILIWIGRLIQK